jgi:thioredoxin reductase (NADPH)
MYDVIIIGGGPAGLTAAVYCRRAGKTVLVIEKAAFGGQITWSPKVENFPTIGSISGSELGDRLTSQAMDQGAEVELDEVTAISRNTGAFTVKADSGAEYEGRAVIIATGAKPRELGLADEERFIGNGECFCAVCDGAFFAGRPVAVNGGGNSALQDAVMLSEKCSKVYLIHRRASFRGEEKLAEALKARENVELVLESRIVALKGGEALEGVTVENAAGERRDIAVDGLFVCVGREPVNGAFSEYMQLDAAGYALAGEDCLTGTPGVFVAGDCRKKEVRQLTTAAADGSVAALAACRYLDSL